MGGSRSLRVVVEGRGARSASGNEDRRVSVGFRGNWEHLERENGESRGRMEQAARRRSRHAVDGGGDVVREWSRDGGRVGGLSLSACFLSCSSRPHRNYDLERQLVDFGLAGCDPATSSRLSARYKIAIRVGDAVSVRYLRRDHGTALTTMRSNCARLGWKNNE